MPPVDSHVLCLVRAASPGGARPSPALLQLAGLSLLAHAVRSARRFAAATSANVAVVVETDDEPTAREAHRWGVEVVSSADGGAALPESDAAALATALDAFEARGHRCTHGLVLSVSRPTLDIDDVLHCWEPVAQHEVDAAATVTGHVQVTTVESFRATGALAVPGRMRLVVPSHLPMADLAADGSVEVAEALLRRRPPTMVAIGDREVGPDQPCFVIAEAGVNHNGDPELARRLVEVAAAAGADAVKFQTFDPATIAASGAPKAAYQRQGTDPDESQLEMLRALALPLEAFADLQRHADKAGILFLSTPFDAASGQALVDLEVPAIKVGSGELTNHRLLAALARHGRPILLSTGMADARDVSLALDVLAAAGDPPVALFHCVSDYPADPADANLEAMATMRACFRVPVGWSDHTPGLTVSVAAAALGAELIEKHVTVDRGLPGPDHRASLEPDEFAALVREIRVAEAARGDGVKRPRPAETATAAVARRSLHTTRALPSGHLLAAEDLVALRPGTGISPADEATVTGRRLRRAVEEGHQLVEEDLT